MTDHDASGQVAGEISSDAEFPQRPEAPQPPHAAIQATLQPVINAALWQNSVPVLSELSLTNLGTDTLDGLTIDLTSEPPILRPRTWRLQQLRPGQIHPVTDLDIDLDGLFLGQLTEATRSVVTFTARSGDVVLAAVQREPRILAANEWGGCQSIPDILAAFVQPNDPAVSAIIRAASDLLRAGNKPDGLEGYQGGKARVWEQAQAVWGALCRLDIRYVNPPASFVMGGQRIRSPHQVVDERLATCLDTSVLFAACFEAVGLHPMIVLLQGHAFAGLWLSKGDFGGSTVDDVPGLRTRLKLDDLLLFETTLATNTRKPSFRQALQAGADHITPDKDDQFQTLIDIHRARHRRILPLATSAGPYALQATAEEQAADLPPPMEEAPPLREEIAIADDPAPATAEGRLARWRKRLLDLSGRNRLVNLPEGGKTALFIDCPDPAALEDMLAGMRGHAKAPPFRFRPWPDLMDGRDPRSAALHRSRLHEEASRGYAQEALAKRELLVGREDAVLQTTLTEIYRKGRADQQEGGSNTLFLTIGSLLWRQHDREKPFRAPLILVPVVLERPSVRSGYVLRVHDDETRLNSTLLELLREQFSIRMPALEAERPPEDEAGFDVPRILDLARAKVRDIPGWEVRDEVALTTLSFTKYLMWKDLADRAEALRENVVVRRLMDGPMAPHPTEPSRPDAAPTPDGGRLDAGLSAAGLVCPLEADSSQMQAVARAASGESFVLIGPPGTGKSQTIANIIANTLAQGRTVLFVAEKRAALEVVQRRLHQVGLDDFALDLFSSKANKAEVLKQLERAQAAHDRVDPADWDRARDDLSALHTELNAYVQELHRRFRNGWTVFRAIGCVLRAESGGIPAIPLSWPELDGHDAGFWQRLVEVTEEARATLDRVGGTVRSPALAGIEQPEWSPLWQTRLLESAQAAVATLTSLDEAACVAAKATGLTALGRSRLEVEALCRLADILLDPLALEAGWAVADTAPATLASVQAAAERMQRHRTLQGELRVAWRPDVMALPLKDLQSAWRAAGEKWALPRMLAQRAVHKRLAPSAGDAVEDCGHELDRLVEMADIALELQAPPSAAALGSAWRALDTDFARLVAVYSWAQRLRTAIAACTPDAAGLLSARMHLRQLVTDGADLLAPAAGVGRALRQLVKVNGAAVTALGAVSVCSRSEAPDLVAAGRTDWLPALAAHLVGWGEASRMIQDWCAWRGVVQAAGAVGLGPLLDAMAAGTIAPGDAMRAMEANYARWWVGLAVDEAPRLRSFVAARHETRLERFRQLDAKLLGLASRLARTRLSQSVPGAAQRQHDPEYALLTRELAKRTRHLPVRQLALRMPTALRRLTPCLMMSPLSVAQYLPAEAAAFDLVVFDEASQIPTWDAIGAVGRGRQVIIVGDPRQLPPTSFFERRVETAGEEATEIETHDLDSILDECLGAGIPTVELSWHYRSRHESLIAFSNNAYYGGRLVTFPSPVTSDQAVAFRHVPDGVYARGAARTNQKEAGAVVAEALAVLRAGKPRSLGIVTFNAEQQTLIEDLLDRARRDDPALERHFGDDCPEPVLVKNLEGIQGEERDVMLFSLTYGPDETGRIAFNFGPLNLSGGERRLNVAITRARERLLVFGSIKAEQIDLSRTAAVGVAHLKRFLAFAEQGVRSFATAATRPLGDHESPFEAEVADRLRQKGWVVHPQIGVSGFRIDLAVVDPDIPGRFLAGIECDGATYHRASTARDRDRLRQTVLEGLGWSILRVWSTDWWTNAGRETDRLHAALSAYLEAFRQQRLEQAVPEAEQKQETADQALPELPGRTESVSEKVSPCGDSLQATPSMFYEDSYREHLAAIVAQSVGQLAPMRDDRLVQHVARLHGFGRVGREIKERVLAVVSDASPRTTEGRSVFIWPEGVDPAAWDRFRRPAPGTSIDPNDLPIEELTTLARDCTRAGGSDEAVLLAMRDACGLRRLMGDTRQRCWAALDRSRRSA